MLPAAIIGELKAPAPAGTEDESTVCVTVSLLVQVTVLLTPITTVIVSGEKPGAALGPTLVPFGIATITATAVPEELEAELELEFEPEVELELTEAELELEIELAKLLFVELVWTPGALVDIVVLD